MINDRNINDRNADGLPLVAIVTPVYNGGKFLSKTMESVQAQTYPNIVHIVLNNASSDNSAEIIESFKNRRIPVLAYENETVLPLPANWNRAFSFIPENAVYAKLLCADDLVRPDCIETFVNVAESDPDVQVVLCQDVYDDMVRRARLPRDVIVHDGKAFVRRMMQGGVAWIAYHHFFVRIQPEDRNGNFIDNYWSPDPHVVVRSALRGKLAYLPEPLVYNRCHSDSVTGKELNKRGIQRELVQMHVLHHFGGAVFSGQEKGYKRCVEAWLSHMCRLIVRWQLTHQQARAKEMLKALADNGYHFSRWDYVRHIAGWPINSVRWRLIETALGPHLDEPTFMQMGISGSVHRHA